MLRSDTAPGTGLLKITSPVGTDIAILDGGFSNVGAGTTTWSGSLEDGVYTVVLSAAERSQRWVVRVRAGRTVRFPDDVPGGSDWQRPDPRFVELAGAATADAISAGGSDVFVAVVAPDDEIQADLTRNLRFRRIGDAKMRRDDDASPKSRASNWASVSYDVPPGAYLLTYETFERRLMDQLVYAVPGRRTVVILHYGQAGILERQKEDSKMRKRRGVDPSRTTIVSIVQGGAAQMLLDGINTAEILLYHLRTRVKSLDPSVAAAHKGPTIDPYLKLYAAAATLAMPGPVMHRLATAVRQDSDHEPEGSAEATRLHRELQHYDDWTDVTCLGWRLKEQFPSEQPLTAPPMLEICWRWATAHSARYQDRMTLEPAVALAASQAEPNASPWFVISAAPVAATAPTPATPEKGKDIQQALIVLVKNVMMALDPLPTTKTATPSKARPGFAWSPSIDFSKLSPNTERVVQAIISSGAIEPSISASAILPQLAASMASPIDALGRIIEAAVDELSSLVNQERDGGTDVWNSDPHKGAFGRDPTCQGATLSLASFQQTDGIEFLALHLEVRVDPQGAPLTGPVTFYLHPTFSPSTQMVAPLGDVASFTCYAWGGFTVGAETSDGRRMELDLASLGVLPMWFRTR